MFTQFEYVTQYLYRGLDALDISTLNLELAHDTFYADCETFGDECDLRFKVAEFIENRDDIARADRRRGKGR